MTIYSRLILIAEKASVYDEFSIPLINRLEKHFILYSSVLEDWQTDTLAELEIWIKEFSHISGSQSRYVHLCTCRSLMLSSTVFSLHHEMYMVTIF